MADNKSDDEFGDLDDEDLLLAVEEAEQIFSSQSSQLTSASSQTITSSSQTFPSSSQSLATSPPAPTSSYGVNNSYYSSQPYSTNQSSQSSQPYPMTNSAEGPPLGEITSNRNATAYGKTAPATEYRFSFGKHRGKTMDEVPSEYLSWVEKQDWIDKPMAEAPGLLRAALEAFKKKEKGPYKLTFSAHKGKTLDEADPGFIDWLNSTPGVTDQYPGLEKALKDFNDKKKKEPYKLTFGAHKGKTLDQVDDSFIDWLNSTPGVPDQYPGLANALKEFNARKPKGPYVLPFSSHKGKTLEQCPATFIDYLRQNPEIVDKRPDLKKALKSFKKNNRRSQISEARNSSWTPPSSTTTDARRFHKNGRQMWIAESDTLRFFGVEPAALEAAGLRHCRSKAFWVHQVFSFAKHHGTMYPDTATKALSKFKAKNYNG